MRTRNARLTAIRSFFHYAALKAPEQAELIARVLSRSPRNGSTRPRSATSPRPRSRALLRAPDRSTSTGRRDHVMLLLAVQTGLRVSELAALCCQDVQLDATPWARTTRWSRPSAPAGRVACSEQRSDLALGEVGDEVALGAFRHPVAPRSPSG